MGEEFYIGKNLDPRMDESGNFIEQAEAQPNVPSYNAEHLSTGSNMETALPYLSTQKQAEAAPYIDIKIKISHLPIMEKMAVNDILVDFFDQVPKEDIKDVKDTDVVQLMLGSSRNLNDWHTSRFHTKDGAFEHFVETKLRPAVEAMYEDLVEKKKKN